MRRESSSTCATCWLDDWLAGAADEEEEEDEEGGEDETDGSDEPLPGKRFVDDEAMEEDDDEDGIPEYEDLDSDDLIAEAGA